MTFTHQLQWSSAADSIASALHPALDPHDTHGNLAAASACDAVSAALADVTEQWNATHPDTLLCLPTELVRAIFRLLEFRDRIAVSHVSRGWRATTLADRFLWNAVRFPVAPPEPLENRSHKEPPREAGILRTLLARSDPAPFALAWERQHPALLPDEMVDVLLTNLQRMRELTTDLSADAFARLFALPAPELRTFRCTACIAPCALPAHWDAPLLRTLELCVVHVPADAQPPLSVEIFSCYALYGLSRPLTELFPALRSLSIEAATPDVVHSLRDLPQTLAELTLWTGDAPAIDYAPLLAAWHGRRFALLRLESVRDAAPVLQLFASAVVGNWTMAVGRKGWRLGLVAECEEVTFDVDLSAPVSFAREPRIALHLSRISALSADAALLAQMAASACTLPELRRLALEVAARPEWPSGEPVPIGVPQLVEVSLRLDAEADGGALWATDGFPEILRLRLAYDRPLLASIIFEADPDTARRLDEPHLAGLRELAECVRVDVLGE